MQTWSGWFGWLVEKSVMGEGELVQSFRLDELNNKMKIKNERKEEHEEGDEEEAEEGSYILL